MLRHVLDNKNATFILLIQREMIIIYYKHKDIFSIMA